MKRIGVIPCKMGCGAAAALEKPQLDFYLYLAQAILSEEPAPIHNLPLTPLVVQNEILNARPEAFFTALYDQLQTLGDKAEVVIIDLDIPEMADIRGAAVTNVYMVIHSALEWMIEQRNFSGRLIVLAPEIPVQNSASMRLFQTYLEDQRVIFVSDDGRSEPNGTNYPNFNKEEFCIKLQTFRGKPIDLLHRKLIQQHGHFQRKIGEGGLECRRTYFDGRLCGSEIRQLVQDFVRSHYPNKEPHLLYHHSFSNWLEGPLLRLAGELGLQCHSIDDVLQTPHLGADFLETPPLLIVQLIDSGRTLNSLYDQLDNKFPSQEINCLAILSTSGDKDQSGNRTIQSKVVSYFLRVSQQRYGGECPMCRLSLPFSREGEEHTLMLSAYDFWDMVDTAGLKPEDDAPRHRLKIPLVPDFPKMISLNGAWLSMKIGELLAMCTSKRLNDIVVVCPNQKGSKVLTEYLGSVCGVTVIRVDPNDLLRVRGTEKIDDLINVWETKRPKWYIEITASPTNDVVVMDEFSVSAGTRHAMNKLICHVGKNVLCYFALADFGPQLTSESKTPTLALYDWQVHLVPV